MRRILCLALVSLIATPALADGPGPEPLRRKDPYPGGHERGRAVAPAHPYRPTTRVMGGPDYAGSDWGLGKPMYYGLGSRPDWGRSTAD